MLKNDHFLDADKEPFETKSTMENYETEPFSSYSDVLKTIKLTPQNMAAALRDIQKSSIDPSSNLTKDETAAIHLYIFQDQNSNRIVSNELNKILRSRDSTQLRPWIPYLKLLVSGLCKLPPVEDTIFRGTSTNICSKYERDCIWWGCSSCTKDGQKLNSILKKKPQSTMIRINCVNGKSIRNIAKSKAEDEIILMPGSYLLVTKKETVKRGVSIVELRETWHENPIITSLFGESFSKASASYLRLLAKPSIAPLATLSYPISLQEKLWLTCQFSVTTHEILTPEGVENRLQDPPGPIDATILDRVHGSMVGMALGDALGAHVEFRPRTYLLENPVKELEGGGTWGLKKGQFTDDTSMALCLAASLVIHRNFTLYDQLVRYKMWYKHGYMSSTGQCFDIGAATKQSLDEFESRQQSFVNKHEIPLETLDHSQYLNIINDFDLLCSEDGVAGNGALMRLAPVPLFFYKHPVKAVHFSGLSGIVTHGDQKARDACRYYGALIVAALNNETRQEILDNNFYAKHKDWFGNDPLVPDVMKIAEGSYKRDKGYDAGIRGKGYIVNALEAALWALWSDEGSFEQGALNAVNLGDDTDTTAAIYGQLAGALYGYTNLPTKWTQHLYAQRFIKCLSKWITYEGAAWELERITTSTTPSQTEGKASNASSRFQVSSFDASQLPSNSRSSHTGQNQARRAPPIKKGTTTNLSKKVSSTSNRPPQAETRQPKNHLYVKGETKMQHEPTASKTHSSAKPTKSWN